VILLDTDVILDVALDRAPWADDAAALLTRLEAGPIGCFVAWHTLSNLYYLLRPVRGGRDARDFLVGLTAFATVVPTGTEDFRFAVQLPVPDLDDAMQAAAAHACGARWIATRNVRDFERSPVPARSPADLLAELA
jgi:predicted nucleic acid-binding protein